jgi:hypothetical protein
LFPDNDFHAGGRPGPKEEPARPRGLCPPAGGNRGLPQ